jgi:hypothetical protein
MSELARLIKTCAVDAVNATHPLALVLGRVIQQEDIPREIPLKILLEQKVIIERDFLYDTDNTYDLKEGDRLLLLRKDGGQMYLLLDKIK